MGKRKSIYLDDRVVAEIEWYRRYSAMKGEILNFSQALSDLVVAGAKEAHKNVRL